MAKLLQVPLKHRLKFLALHRSILELVSTKSASLQVLLKLQAKHLQVALLSELEVHIA